jgi:hypothetical protein
MWKSIFELAKLLFGFGETLQQNKSDIKELQREVRQLATAVQLLVRELQHLRETEALERDRFRLQVENEMLRKLPPSHDESEQKTS